MHQPTVWVRVGGRGQSYLGRGKADWFSRMGQVMVAHVVGPQEQQAKLALVVEAARRLLE